MSETTATLTPTVLNVDISKDIGVFNKDLMTYSVAKQTDYAVLPTFIALLEYKLQPRPITQEVTVENSYKDAKVQITDESTDKPASIDTYIYEFLDTWKDAVVAVYEGEKDEDQKETLRKILELMQKDVDASKPLKEALDSVQSDLKPSDDAANADATNKELDAVKEELSKAHLTQTLSNVLSILKDSLKAKVDEELDAIISKIERSVKPQETNDVDTSDITLEFEDKDKSPTTRLGSLLDVVKNISDENMRLTQELTELKTKLESNSTQLAELSQANNGALAAKLAELSAANEEGTKLKEKLATAEAQLATTNTGMETANAKITELEAQLTSANSALATANDKATNLESQITTKDDELATKVSELTAKDTKITDLETQLQSEKNTVVTLTQKLNESNTQLSQVQVDKTTTDELQKTVEDLQNENTKLTNSLNEINIAMNLKGASIDEVKEKVRLLKINAEMYKTSITSAKYALDQLKVQLSGNNKLNSQVKGILYKYSDSEGRPHSNPMEELTDLLDITKIKASQESQLGGADEYRNKQMKDMMNRTNIKLTDSQFVTATRVFVSFVLLAFSVFATQSAMVRYSHIQHLNAKLGSKAAVFTLVLGCLYPALLSTYALATRSFRTFGMLVATSVAFAISLYISGSVLKSADAAGAESPSKK